MSYRSLLMLTLTIAAASGCSRETPPPSIAITHVTVIDGSDANPLTDATVVISGNRIRSVSQEAPPDGATIIDGTGKYLIPGLWDMHMHVSLLRGPGILPVFLGWGITGVRDMGSPDSIFAWRDEIAAGTRVGPRIVSAGLAFVNQETGEVTPSTWSQGITICGRGSGGRQPPCVERGLPQDPGLVHGARCLVRPRARGESARVAGCGTCPVWYHARRCNRQWPHEYRTHTRPHAGLYHA